MADLRTNVRAWIGPAAGLLLCALGVGITVGLLAASFASAGVRGWDAVTYLAAGERLNAGHDLYALGPGDRWVWINPPYWTVPLLSPPLIAVLWRPLAALPNEWGIAVWWVVSAAAIAIVAFGLIGQLPLATGVALILLAPSLAWELGVANVNGLLIAGTASVWILVRGGRSGWAGGVVAVMAAVKLWPIVLLAWFVARRRWDAVGWFVIVGLIATLVSIAGAGLEAHLQYLSVVGATPPSAFSLAGMFASMGIAIPWISYLVLAFGLGEVWALRSRPELSYAVAVGTMIVGSPVVNGNTYAVLLAALVPFAWPLQPPRTSRLEGGDASPGVDDRRPTLHEPNVIHVDEGRRAG